MTAQRLVENCVLTNQTAVVDEMLSKHFPALRLHPVIPDNACHLRITAAAGT